MPSTKSCGGSLVAQSVCAFHNRGPHGTYVCQLPGSHSKLASGSPLPRSRTLRLHITLAYISLKFST